MITIEGAEDKGNSESPLLRISVLGTLDIQWPGINIPFPKERMLGRGAAPALGLLKAHLTQPDRFALRDWLMEQFWPKSPYSNADERLDDVASGLRGLLRPPGCTAKILHFIYGKDGKGNGYRLEGYPQIWVDADAFEWYVQQAARLDRFGRDSLSLWEQAYQLGSRGEFMPDERYSDWVQPRREQLQGQYRQCVHRVVQLLREVGAYEQALLRLRNYWQGHKTDEDALRPLLEMLGERERYQEAQEYYEQAREAVQQERRDLDEKTQDVMEYLRAQPIQRERAIEQAITVANQTHSVHLSREKSEESVNRREANKILGTFSFQLFSSNSTRDDFLSFPFSSASLHNLTVITQQFREMQRRGDPFFRLGLDAHITTIQDILTSTTEDTIRRELWRLSAQTQLLVRLGYPPNPAKRQELAQGKTYNELAIAYAQLSGDTALKGGTIGHLAQFYLRQEPDLAKATQYINEAQPFARGNDALTGWLSLLQASIDAKTGRAQQCEKDLAYAMDRAHNLPQLPEYSDVYYTDFSLVSTQAFCVNCWLTTGNPTKAQICFTEMNLADLSENRQAGTLYDVSRLYASLGDLNLAQSYAFQAIDKAIKTHQLYVISRCRKLATTILEKEKHEPHATAILEYAQIIQEHHKRSTDLC